TLTRPPTPTLFPYTTLFRSLHRRLDVDDHAFLQAFGRHAADADDVDAVVDPFADDGTDFGRAQIQTRYQLVLGHRFVLPRRALRSEEHTSELQSLAYLVCRL